MRKFYSVLAFLAAVPSIVQAAGEPPPRVPLDSSALEKVASGGIEVKNDTYQTTERFHVDDPNFTAFHPNGSGNGRNIDMLRRMVIDEREEAGLWLLRGCPRRWFEPGRSIAVRDAPTLWGVMSIRARSEAGRIEVDIEGPEREVPPAVVLAVRSPRDRPIRSATINGKAARVRGDAIDLPAARGPFRVAVELASGEGGAARPGR